MKLWLLKIRHEPDCCDEQVGVVVRALSPRAARKLAAATAGDEGKEIWLSPELSICLQLHESGSPCVVLRDFRAG